MKIIFIALALLATLYSCNRSPAGFIDIVTFQGCHKDLNLDSLATIDRLLGEWRWEFIECYSQPGEVNSITENIRVRFNQNQTVDIIELNQEISTTWSIRQNSILEVDTFVNGFGGQMFFCQDQLVFANSFIDLCDVYLRRVE